MGDSDTVGAPPSEALPSDARPAGPPRRRRLSIGAKLTLRYTAAIAVTLTIVVLFVYVEVTRRINREAKLLLEVEIRELADELRTRTDGTWTEDELAALRERFERLVRTSDPTLRVGVALVGSDGEDVIRTGMLSRSRAPIPRAVLRGEEPSSLRAVNLGEPFAYLAMAMSVPGGAVQMVLSTERYADNIRSVREVFLLSFPLVIVLTAIAGFFLADTTLRPIRDMTRTARRISTATIRDRLALTGSGDELDRLAETLNEMLARIEDGLSRMRRFNANAAHELRTPLAALSSQIDVTLERARTPAEYREVLEDAHGRVHTLSDLVEAMLRLARSEAGIAPEDLVPVAIPPVLENVHEFFEPLAEEGGVTLHKGSLPHAVVLGDASWLHQLFANLVANAVKFTPAGGSVRIDAEVVADRLHVRVSDTGPGISSEDLQAAFERFQRGTGARGLAGFGLGLPIAREIARAHGGDVQVESGDHGTQILVSLPIRADAQP